LILHPAVLMRMWTHVITQHARPERRCASHVFTEKHFGNAHNFGARLFEDRTVKIPGDDFNAYRIETAQFERIVRDISAFWQQLDTFKKEITTDVTKQVLETNVELGGRLSKVTVAQEEAGSSASVQNQRTRSHDFAEASLQDVESKSAIHEPDERLLTSSATVAQHDEFLRSVVSEANVASEELGHNLSVNAEVAAQTLSLQNEVEQLRAQLVASQNDVGRLTAELLAERAFSRANPRLAVELMQEETDAAGKAILEGRSEVATADTIKTVSGTATKQIEATAEGEFAVQSGVGTSINSDAVETQNTLVLLIGMIEVDRDSNQGGNVEAENTVPVTSLKPIDTFWSEAHFPDKVDVPGISDVMAEVKRSWNLLPSWKARLKDSNTSAGTPGHSRVMQGRVLLLDHCEEVQSLRVLDLQRENAECVLDDVEIEAAVKSSKRDLRNKETENLVETSKVPFVSCESDRKKIAQATVDMSMLKFQKQNEDMLDWQSELETWSPGSSAEMFRVRLENVHTPSCVQSLTETPRGLSFSEAASDSGTFTSCDRYQTQAKQTKPGTKLDQLRCSVKETSLQVGSAINRVTCATQCSPPVKKSGVTNCKVDWFSQWKLKEPIKPSLTICDSGSTAKLVGHGDPRYAQHVHEHISSTKSKDLSTSTYAWNALSKPLEPSSRSRTCFSTPARG